jgi:hypothetical protein
MVRGREEVGRPYHIVSPGCAAVVALACACVVYVWANRPGREWTDSRKCWKLAFGSHVPIGWTVVHARYETLGYGNISYQYSFEVSLPNGDVDSCLSSNGMEKADSETNWILKHSYFGGPGARPSWFAPKEHTNYTGWFFTNSYNAFRILVEEGENKAFISDYQSVTTYFPRDQRRVIRGLGEFCGSFQD